MGRNVMCNCHSYNGAEGETPEANLNIAQYFPWYEHTRPVVSIDACIARDIEKLWAMGIYTRGSCCGHGDDKKGPSVVLASEADSFLAKLFLPRDRNYQILCWKLINLTSNT